MNNLRCFFVDIQPEDHENKIELRFQLLLDKNEKNIEIAKNYLIGNKICLYDLHKLIDVEGEK